MEHLSSPLRKIQDEIALRHFGMTKTDALEKGICVKCKEEATMWGRYLVSGLCETCYVIV